MSQKNYYKILEISETATQEEIKKAYKRLALKHHPDKGGSEAEFKKLGEAYEVLSDPDRRKQYDKDGSTSSLPSGLGIGAPPVFDYSSREAAWKEIENALKSRDVNFYHLNNECHLISCQGCANSPYLHIFICLETQSEVDNFKNHVLASIDKYATDLKQLKEEVIRRIENYLDENKENLSNDQKALFEESTGFGINGLRWREYIRNDIESKESLINFEKNRKWLIDDFKRNNKGYTGDRDRKGKGDRYYQGNGNRKKTSSNSDKTAHEIAQLKLDIEELKHNLSNPKLTEKEKVEVQEKLDRFEKRLEELESQSNSDSNSKDNGSDDKDQKISQLEAEIRQLKSQNSGTQTPEQQAEIQKKIEEKEKELEEVKKDKKNNKDNSQNGNSNGKSLAHQQLINEIKKLQTEIEKLKNSKDINNNSQKKTELESKEKRLKELEQKLKKTNPNDTQKSKSDNNFPTGLVVGGGVIVAMGLVVAFVIKKNRKKRHS